MDSLRTFAIAFLMLLLLSSAASSTPIDATWDLLDAVEYRDGDRFLDLMSESVRLQIELSFQQLKDMMEQDPGLVETLLRESGMGLTTWDLEWMTEADFISRLLEKVNLPPLENITSEEVSMTGRNAEVVFTWYSGYSILIQLTWEHSSWKVTGSPVLDQLF
jgi:hypothetical protein